MNDIWMFLLREQVNVAQIAKLRVKSLIFFICLFLPCLAFAQNWNINLNIDPYPSPYLSEWESNPTIGQAIIENISGDTISVIVHLTITHSTHGEIASASSNPVEFPPGSFQDFATSELVDWGTLDYSRDI